MNSIHSFLSNVILALSVSTLLLTLLSYLVFKIKQLPKTFSNQAVTKPTRGTFFTRYQPFPEVVVETDEQAIAFLNYRPFWAKSAGAFFAVITGIVFVTLGSEQFISQHSLKKDRKARAQNFQELKSNGLLQTYPFDAHYPSPVLEEWISPNKREALKGLIGLLKDKKIGLMGTKWKSYLINHHVSANQAEWGSLNQFDAIIFSGLKTLTAKQKKEIDEIIAKRKFVLVSGEFESDNEINDKWLAQTFGIEWIENSEFKNFPTLMRGDGAPGWGVTAGTLLEWSPNSTHKVAVESKLASHEGYNQEAALFQSNFEGRVMQANGKPIVREVLTSNAHSRSAWLGLEPPLVIGGDTYYEDELVFRTLSWGMQLVLPQIEQWKNASKAAIVLSVDSEDLFEGASRLRRLFEKEEVPATFFIVADLLEASPGLIKDAKGNFDFSSHTASHGIIEKLPLYDQFRELERSRLMIEEIANKKVRGFRPPEERFDTNSLNAALQSHYEYFFGDQHLHRFGPVSVAGGKLIYYPRSSLDDIILINDHSISDEGEMAQVLESEMGRIRLAHGAYLVSFHSQYFGQDPFFESVRPFIESLKKEDIWKTDFSEMTRFTRARESVKIKTQVVTPNKMTLIATNESEDEINGLGIFIGQTVRQVSDFQAKIVHSNALGSRLIMPRIPAKQSVKVELTF